MTTPILFNCWDCTAENMNGSDKDGDCVISTDNPILIKNTFKMPAIRCVQYKASKKIVTEDDIVESNLLGFGNAVGSITNKATAMFEVQARFPKDSEEYKVLDYRTKCGQLYQQAEIDKIKGIKAKPMPSHWCNFFATKIEDDDSEEVRQWKEFNRRIVSDKKPYFFQYVYPIERTKWIKYKKETEMKSLMLFGRDFEEILADIDLNEEEKLFLENYYKRLPLGIAPCTINKICWKIEDEFKTAKFKPIENFDYRLLKSLDTFYDEKAYSKIEELYLNYLKDRKILDSLSHSDKISDSDLLTLKNNLCQRFRKEAAFICPNRKVLCNILLDICYMKSKSSKRFVWDMCGDIIVDNLLERNNYCFTYPVQDKNGEFEFGGLQFKMICHRMM